MYELKEINIENLKALGISGEEVPKEIEDAMERFEFQGTETDGTDEMLLWFGE